MKPIPDCIPDLLREVLATARLVSEDGFIHRKVLTKVMHHLVEGTDLDVSPAELALECIEAAYKALGVKDPYDNEKARLNKSMMGLEQEFRAYIEVAPQPLDACINLMLAGRVEDLTVLGRKDMEMAVFERIDAPVGIDDSAALYEALTAAKSVMVILNAAGEIILDKIFMERYTADKKLTAVVSAKPMLTRATREDATAIDLASVAEVIDPGAAMYGVALSHSSKEFQDRFHEADVVIAKGEINFETLAGCGREFFTLMQCACPNLAKRLSVTPGSSVLMHCKGESTDSA